MIDENKLQKYLEKWLNFSRSGSAEDVESATNVINALYRQLGLREPQVIPCYGPLEQLVFPTLVDKMLRHGYEQIARLSFARQASEPSIVRTEWSDLWQSARQAIDWKKHDEAGDRGIGALLNQTIDRRLERILKIQLTITIDTVLGMECNIELQNRCRSLLERPYDAMRTAISYHDADVQNLWKSFLLRLPDSIGGGLKAAKKKEMQEQIFGPSGVRTWLGGWDLHWMASAAFAHEGLSTPLPSEIGAELALWTEFAMVASAFLACESCCFVYLKPAQVHFDDAWRLHHASDAAIQFSDATAFYYWHGVEVPDHIIKSPQSITVKDIVAERNIELRRVMIERYGLDHFIRASAAKIVHEDECGVLYRKEIPGDEDLVVLKVLNSTPEPDGTFKTYFLRVPPWVRRARQAAAWTFNMEETEYKPKLQT